MSTLKPIITICGTTGVGKSKLSIELALKLAQGMHGWKGARIINADSMQVYTGMDVITNKVPVAERMGVEHLLMDFKQPGEQYVVGQWVQDAIKAIDETHRMDMIPIIVGGTSYWIQHLIFPNRLPTPGQSLSDSVAQSIANLPPELLELFNALPEHPPSAASHPQDALLLHNLLTALDEPVAQRWHWRDTRKVMGSLRVIKDTGKAPSEIIIEQSKTALIPRYRTLCFWVYAEPSILNERLDARVDDMIKEGLLNEIKELRAIASSPARSSPDAVEKKPAVVTGPSDESAAKQTDYTVGIYQSIGYKEFHDYLASPEPSEKLFASAVEQMKYGTRQYAKRQIRWLKNKLLPAIYSANGGSDHAAALLPVYLLDATELGDQWTSCVLNQGERITEAFLGNETLLDPLSLSERAREMLTIDVKPTSPTEILRARKKVVCPACTLDPSQPFMVEAGSQWEAHRRSRTHRRHASRDKKMHGQSVTRRATVHSDIPSKVDAEDQQDQQDQHRSIV
ncbi:tRNA isopentenyltransferase [Suillus subalutaceus]|uniref:tRNA isopentenyltransferase n=1 Tax=Suillus subalutaceus TaxID=48586 RepID=UPI001B87C8A1|nr:tRNA isopentenyltransferase [Suillus subalutaceus]KAG1836655.1 tRNA isopentenyltransferase [Suillus subalutaceus]